MGAPQPILVLLVLALALGGPGWMMGFDLALTFNPPDRLGTATEPEKVRRGGHD